MHGRLTVDDVLLLLLLLVDDTAVLHNLMPIMTKVSGPERPGLS